MDMQYKGDHRTLTMERIEEVLVSIYGESDYDRESGCSKNGHWFSVDDILDRLSYFA